MDVGQYDDLCEKFFALSVLLREMHQLWQLRQSRLPYVLDMTALIRGACAAASIKQNICQILIYRKL